MTVRRMERDLNLNRPSDDNGTIHVVIADGDTLDGVPVASRFPIGQRITNGVGAMAGAQSNGLIPEGGGGTQAVVYGGVGEWKRRDDDENPWSRWAMIGKRISHVAHVPTERDPTPGRLVQQASERKRNMATKQRSIDQVLASMMTWRFCGGSDWS
ncbi:uncharacterized protein CLUP02_05998 [Colletotrichum lupini]|uniref:Uncharacterized protein n=1 Tax=Colletotrichum lupini TaxID=145971 RepID=A0A9Q8SP64_9PEZI|nr:uncharacterized protein CLUP02_05998 [Colletotrichum lupini]UQC80515.1 hypothetical protein CLUP02_05998 [Colletotrichum lupini]